MVLRTGSQVFAGRFVVVEHDVDLTTAYYHLSAVEVVGGQVVRRGEIIGRVGATGNATAPHLHFGVCRREGGLCGERIDGGWEDPTRHWIAVNPCFVSAAGLRRPRPAASRTPCPASPHPRRAAPSSGRPALGPLARRATRAARELTGRPAVSGLRPA